MKRILIIIGAFIFINGCTNDIEENHIPQEEINFVVEYPHTRATNNAFDIGDAIGVYITQYVDDMPAPLQVSGNYANNICSTFNGNKWVNSPAVYWSEGKFDVYGYYPYSKPTSVDEYPFSVALDQSDEATENSMSGYEASDFLWAKVNSITQSEVVPLRFGHKMSKLIIRLIKGENFSGALPSDMVVQVHNTVTDAFIDLSSGIVTKNGYSRAQSITAQKISDSEYTAIIVPQRIDNKIPLIEITSKNVSYLIESKFIFRSGTVHTIDITLDNNPDKVRIEIGGEIVDGWE